MLRLKRTNGGEVNLAPFSIISFIDRDKGSTVNVSGGGTFDVEESPRTIRSRMKKAQEGTLEF
jgi:hypothetical protein